MQDFCRPDKNQLNTEETGLTKNCLLQIRRKMLRLLKLIDRAFDGRWSLWQTLIRWVSLPWSRRRTGQIHFPRSPKSGRGSSASSGETGCCSSSLRLTFFSGELKCNDIDSLDCSLEETVQLLKLLGTKQSLAMTTQSCAKSRSLQSYLSWFG